MDINCPLTVLQCSDTLFWSGERKGSGLKSMLLQSLGTQPEKQSTEVVVVVLILVLVVS